MTVDYTDGQGQGPSEYPSVEDKLQKAIDVSHVGLAEYQNPAVVWTGGRDTTLALYLVQRVARSHGFDVPPALFVDHRHHSRERALFVSRWADEWGVKLRTVRNERLVPLAEEDSTEFAVDSLADPDRRYVRRRLGFDGERVRLSPETDVGRYLLETIPMAEALDDEEIDGVLTGTRWEDDANVGETFFSPVHDSPDYPPHDRIQPLLPFPASAAWEVTWGLVVPDSVDGFPDEGYVPADADDLPAGLEPADLPVMPSYFDGGPPEMAATPHGSDPAWLAHLDPGESLVGADGGRRDLASRLAALGLF